MAYEIGVPPELWNRRYEWLNAVEENEQHPLASYLLSSKGVFLSYDLDLAFCAGAWVSVIILAHASIDAIIRDIELGDYRSNSKVIFGGDPELEWLRKLRNSLVHASEGYDPSKLDEVESFHSTLEGDAQRAMKLVYRVMYQSPGT